jgi:hypothetical protein
MIQLHVKLFVFQLQVHTSALDRPAIRVRDVVGEMFSIALRVEHLHVTMSQLNQFFFQVTCFTNLSNILVSYMISLTFRVTDCFLT